MKIKKKKKQQAEEELQTKLQTPLSANWEEPALSQFLVPGRATQRL